MDIWLFSEGSLNDPSPSFPLEMSHQVFVLWEKLPLFPQDFQGRLGCR